MSSCESVDTCASIAIALALMSVGSCSTTTAVTGGAAAAAGAVTAALVVPF
jgi:hypothetical protein